MTDSAQSDRSGIDLDRALEEELLTVQDAARLLNVTTSWVYEHTRAGVEGQLPSVKIGKYLRFDRRDLRAYIDRRREAARVRARR